MKIMVVGGGGREHAIIKKLKENKEITDRAYNVFKLIFFFHFITALYPRP